jgi:hypothetical protein
VLENFGLAKDYMSSPNNHFIELMRNEMKAKRLENKKHNINKKIELDKPS